MQYVKLINNPLDPTSWEEVAVPDVRDYLMERYPEWPPSARIYAGAIGADHDVTPATPGDVERLADFESLTVIVYPEGPLAIVVAIIAIAVIIAIALTFLLPKIPSNQQTSTNNSLANRSNKARPNERIPDIFGQVRSVPDLLAGTYRVYENHHEIELAYMCIGRGAYEIEDVRDDNTLISEIQGASISVYAPGDSPNNSATPQLQIGTAISDPVFNANRLNEVNGQTLLAPNSAAVLADKDISFRDGGIIEAAGSAIDFTQFFTAGSTITIGNGATVGETEPASAIFAAATGLTPNIFSFASFDPSGSFVAGQTLIVGQAVWVTTGASTGGGISGGSSGGGSDNPNYPDDRIPTEYQVPLE